MEQEKQELIHYKTKKDQLQAMQGKLLFIGTEGSLTLGLGTVAYVRDLESGRVVVTHPTLISYDNI
mgnify:CR=1 FL=1